MNKKISLIVEQAVEYILTRDIEELKTLTVEKIAGYLNVDTFYLLKAFENEQNVVLKNFITREKIYRAVFILEKNQCISIDEISEKLGFSQANDFAAEFQEYLAIDPHRYKELRSMQKIA
ncbi:MAG: hypothetical protein MUF15_26025 [Acidobacteria bacterium]|nr:hypothetical protein [Acidobacteriota bacterium]